MSLTNCPKYRPTWRLETDLFTQHIAHVPEFSCKSNIYIAGLDEAGRGALAGPVMVAVVCLPASDLLEFNQKLYDSSDFDMSLIDDSKKLTPEARAYLAKNIKQKAIFWSVGSASAQEIDIHNVLQATHIAAYRALKEISPLLDGIVTDYLHLKKCTYPISSPAKADTQSIQVAAASILAKTARDAYMQAEAENYQNYGFAQHKGYGTKAHLVALKENGVSPIHRKTFKPVARVISGLS